MGSRFVVVAVLSLTCGTVMANPPVERHLHLPAVLYRYSNQPLPPHFEPRWVAALDTTPADNPTTDAGATLGRVLFYDTRLSASRAVSCGTCHVQKYAFAEPLAVSIGHEGRKGDRNAMSLVNLRWARAGYFWDERAETLEEAVGLPVRSRIEMAGPGTVGIATSLASDPQYAPLFSAAFGTPTVTDERVRKALAQFIRAMVSSKSKYDRGAMHVATVKEDFPGFTTEENLGKSLFIQHCNLCHHIGEGSHVAFFDMFRALDNGIDPDADAPDGGRGDITFNPTEVGQFRASSLRNVAVTAPYMHDGRFTTLEQVVEHYSTGVKRHPNAGAVFRLGLSGPDKAALVAFLKTLTDETFMTDPRFSDPWSGGGVIPSSSMATSGTVLPKSTVKSESVATRLARGQGLEVGEVAGWLRLLDKNGDGSLDKVEIEPIVAVLVKTRVGNLSTGRVGGNRPARGGRSGQGKNGDNRLTGDFDGNGLVDEAESRLFAAYQRLTELGDGDRLRRLVRTDRFLGGFELTVPQAEEARKVLNAGRTDRADRVYARDVALMKQLVTLIGAEAVARFQTRVIDQQVAAVRRRTSREDDPRPDVERQVAGFDTDEDGVLTPAELSELAKALDRLAGGFGQEAPRPIDMAQFTRRFLSYDPNGRGSVAVAMLPERLADAGVRGDQDRNGVLSPVEIEHHIRASAFGQLLTEGVYIGGGFVDTLVRHADLLAELGLPDEKRTAAEALFAEHEKAVDALTVKAITDGFPSFRDAVGRKVPRQVKR